MSNSVPITGEEVELVQEYKYLSVHQDNRQIWRRNTDTAYKKR